MSNPTWPAPPFPQEPLINPKRQPASNVLVSETEAGTKKWRQRSSRIRFTYEVQLALTNEELEEFDEFHFEDCKGGAQPFDWKDPLTNATKSFRITGRTDDNMGGPGLTKVSLQMEDV